MNKLIILIVVASFPYAAWAETLWSDFSVTYLNGSDYEVGDPDRQVVTFEHVAGLSWGDSFLFVDRLESDNGSTETYAEWSPRIKISQYENSFLKNIYVATTAEIGDGFTHYLVGVGTDIKMPHFTFLKLNLYHRNNELGDNGEQVTVAWAVPIGPLNYDGFIDFVPSNNDNETSMNMTSQLKYNLSPHINITTPLYLGIEYVHWQNKFGIDDVDENNVNLLVKYHF
ncbi:outer membrane protein OmpK [Thalassotalea atypica]|uniref:outer membrane protein OmpK n=1 Tax=Thalassotalea atypica TaxID=2054316 RepID=UPI0025731A98|nr:outer membrane protein OmpK [Thalassotalea atypica]